MTPTSGMPAERIRRAGGDADADQETLVSLNSSPSFQRAVKMRAYAVAAPADLRSMDGRHQRWRTGVTSGIERRCSSRLLFKHDIECETPGRKVDHRSSAWSRSSKF